MASQAAAQRLTDAERRLNIDQVKAGLLDSLRKDPEVFLSAMRQRPEPQYLEIMV